MLEDTVTFVEQPLKLGDVVKLKSGGPLMTVASFAIVGATPHTREVVNTLWFIQDTLQYGEFSRHSLVKG